MRQTITRTVRTAACFLVIAYALLLLLASHTLHRIITRAEASRLTSSPYVYRVPARTARR